MGNQLYISKDIMCCEKYFQDSLCSSVEKKKKRLSTQNGSRDMAIFEEFNSGFVKDLSSLISNWYLCETHSPDLNQLSSFCPLLAPGTVSGPSLSLPLCNQFSSGRCQCCLTWIHHSSSGWHEDQ